MNLEVQHLSHTFLTDAAHLIEKARHANTSMAPNKRTSYIAKLVIDVYLACECALKSMIASANIDKPGSEVYARILNHGHNLKRLMKDADPKSIDADARNFLKQASKRGIHLRYSLELFSVTTCELLQDDTVGFRIDQDYLKKFSEIGVSLAKEAKERHQRVCGSGTTSRMTPEQLKEYVNNLREVSKKSRKSGRCCA